MDETYKRTPISFGPFPGPRQTHTGQKRRNSLTTALTATITFKTLKSDLQGLLPVSNYTFQTPSSDPHAYASLVSKRLANLDWLAGRGYDLYILYIHGVQYTRPEDGQTFCGSFLPVLFENMADPIVSGREELGWPKLFSDILIQYDGASYMMAPSWQGSCFGSFALDELEEVVGTSERELKNWAPPESAGKNDGILLHRYVPQVGRPGVADADYQVWVDKVEDAKLSTTTVTRKWIAKKSSFTFNQLDWQKLPTLHHIVAKLAELTIVEIVEGLLVDEHGASDYSVSRKI